MNEIERGEQRAITGQGVGVGLLAMGLLLTLSALVQPCAIDGFYLQPWSSETMMQTLAIEDLRQQPWSTLWHLHIQPPLFDGLRALLVAGAEYQEPGELVRLVDQRLYWSWAVGYGLLVMLLFVWMQALTSRHFALVTALLFALHPAAIFYATMLDTTFLSSLLITWMYYLLWRSGQGGGVLILALLGLALLLLFFTRSLFQWPWLLVLAVTLWAIALPWRRWLLLLLVVGGGMGLYVGKQYDQFDTLSTSTFAGHNLVNSVGISDSEGYWRYLLSQPAVDEGPAALIRAFKATGTPNFNHLHYLDLNQQLLADYQAHLAAVPLTELVAGYWYNLELWLRPSSAYTEHHLVDRLPWRGLYDTLFSGGWLLLLLLLASLHWLLRRAAGQWRHSLGLLLPGLFIFATTVLFERGENMRLKFFIEPLLLLFIAVQLYHASHWLKAEGGRLRRRYQGPGQPPKKLR